MIKERYRVIQWSTGNIGQIAIKHFAENPVFELVGVFVSNPDKAGKDAGDLAGVASMGIIASDDMEAMLALAADCIHYAPLVADVDLVCRMLRSGKNVVSPSCCFYPTSYFKDDFEKVEAACREAGVSFHGTGIHPGFAGDILPLTFARLMSRLDQVHVYELVDFSNDTSPWCVKLGFGRDPAEVLANPSRGGNVVQIFAQSMAMFVEGLGKKIENISTKFEVAKATQDFDAACGTIPEGTVGGMHFEWTAWVDAKPLVVFHQYWTMSDDLEPYWGMAGNKYSVVFEGDPPFQVTFEATETPASGDMGHWGRVWTAMNGVNAIPRVCDSAPGIITSLDLGLVRPQGLVRPKIGADR